MTYKASDEDNHRDCTIALLVAIGSRGETSVERMKREELERKNRRRRRVRWR